jgi:hypothetical protein
VNVSIRPVDLNADRDLLIDALSRYLTPLSDARRFDWLYCHNPHGEAQAWMATDTDQDTIIGAAGAFPRRFYVNDDETYGWVLGDFCINATYRSLGPALQLQRACLTAVEAGKMPFCFDFPSTRMMAVYKRLRIQQNASMLRLAKPLRIDHHVKQRVNSPIVARGVSVMGNLLLRLRDTRRTSAAAATISCHEGPCGEEFSALAREVGSRYGVCVQRSAAYLNWRYLAHPLHRYECLTARREGTLRAYAMFTHTGEEATLVEWFGIEEAAILGGLIEEMVSRLRQRGVNTVSAPLGMSHPWIGLLQQLGFRVREAAPVVIYGSPCPRAKASTVEAMKWFLMQGDRES